MFLTLKEKTVRTHYDFIIYPSLMALFNRLIHVIVATHFRVDAGSATAA